MNKRNYILTEPPYYDSEVMEKLVPWLKTPDIPQEEEDESDDLRDILQELLGFTDTGE